MSMPAVTSWCWDMAGVLLPLWVRFGPTSFYMCHRRIRAEHNLGLLIPFEPMCRTHRHPRNPVLSLGLSSTEVFGVGFMLLRSHRVNDSDRRCITLIAQK